jgi:hypothetical protein
MLEVPAWLGKYCFRYYNINLSSISDKIEFCNIKIFERPWKTDKNTDLKGRDKINAS